MAYEGLEGSGVENGGAGASAVERNAGGYQEQVAPPRHARSPPPKTPRSVTNT